MKYLALLFLPYLLSNSHILTAQMNCPIGVTPTHSAMQGITEVVVYDVFTPPVASRIYAYSSIAGYTAYAYSLQKPSFTEKLQAFPAIPKPAPDAVLCPSLSSSVAMMMTAKSFLFSEEMIDSLLQELIEDAYEPQLPATTIIASVAYGTEVAKSIIQWSKTDQFRETRKLDRYTPLEGDGYWEPTPPDHADAVEPYWGMLRTFVLDSSSQCRPTLISPFSTDINSAFFADAMEVVRTKQTLTEEQMATVWFWDDNPFVTVHQGHLVFAKKKVSPGGHWMGITRIAIEQSGADMEKALRSYTLVSIALADAFISCWEEKYHTNLLRPVTYINRYIDAGWEPYLQTPPFPEFTSGHSVISSAAATVLTELYGESFSYTDQVLVKYGQPARNYSSFQEAATEAAYSRLYGGIHYRPGIEAGSEQGRQIGALIIAKLL